MNLHEAEVKWNKNAKTNVSPQTEAAKWQKGARSEVFMVERIYSFACSVSH